MKRHLSPRAGRESKRVRPEEIGRVFVGGLAYSTKWQGLKDHFLKVGDVNCANVLLRPDGKSKGCGMVNFRNPEDAVRAVEELNESMLDGRRILVRLDAEAGTRGQPAAGSSGAARLPQKAPVARERESLRRPPQGGEISRIFVGNLAYTTDWQALKDHCKQAGNVRCASVLETPQKRSKGCGMVDFETPEEARRAVELLDGSKLDGRSIFVKVDVDGKNQDGIGLAPRREPKIAPERFSLPPEEICRVFIGNLSFKTNWQALKDHFSPIGDIEFASVLLNTDRTSKGCGMVNYFSHSDAMKAVELLDNSELDGRAITVKLDVDGKFKERPAPGARRQVFQRTKDDPVPARERSPLRNPRRSSGSRAPASSNVAAVLDDLANLARGPAASKIDWPKIITDVARNIEKGKAK